MVLGVRLKVGHANSELDKIIPSLHDIQLKEQKVALKEHLDINKLFPSFPGYYTYKGSLTTPPCFESVRWVVFKEPVEVSEEQLAAFRELNNVSCETECCEGSKIKHNYRPVCPLNDRKVSKSFH
jgi:carbonic anhydrase